MVNSESLLFYGCLAEKHCSTMVKLVPRPDAEKALMSTDTEVEV